MKKFPDSSDADASYSLGGLSDHSRNLLRLIRKCLHLGRHIPVLNCEQFLYVISLGKLTSKSEICVGVLLRELDYSLLDSFKPCGHLAGRHALG